MQIGGSTGQGDPALAAMYRDAGFNAKPDVVNDDELDKHVAEGEREVWRGVQQRRYAEEFATSDEQFPGVGHLGNGTYVAIGGPERRDREWRRTLVSFLGPEVNSMDDISEEALVTRFNLDDFDRRWIQRRAAARSQNPGLDQAALYGGLPGRGGVVRMTLRSDARTITAAELADQQQQELDVLRRDRDDTDDPARQRYLDRKIATLRDPGRYAVWRGYDAVEVDAMAPGELLVLNRGALRVSRTVRDTP